jgi:23S rRNA pseudouridine1911/1915/1917 synthase
MPTNDELQNDVLDESPEGEHLEVEYPSQLEVTADDTGKRLDQYLVAQIPDVSRVRVQQLLEEGKILVNGAPAKSSMKLRGSEHIDIVGRAQPAPLKAVAEDIPLDIVFEDQDLAVVNKPAGMLVHAGAGTGDDPRNRGTLVNAMLFRFKSLSDVSGELRPGIVHRLDKDTSGLIVVAKNDSAHRKLSEQFSSREVNKKYIALVHGFVKLDKGTISAAISRDRVQRTRMSTRIPGGREAVSHYTVQERITSPYGKFTLVEVKIDTGRTHQIRVHMSSIGHPVVGDTLYGAPSVMSPQTLLREARGNAISVRNVSRKIKAKQEESSESRALSLPRNFLHAASIEFLHPRTGKKLSFSSPLPEELEEFREKLRPS